MDLEFNNSVNNFEIRSPKCIQVALNRIIRYEFASGNQNRAADVCESLLLTGMVLFGSKVKENRIAGMYLADLWQQLGHTTEALTLNYVSLLTEVSLRNADGLEIRLRMAELIYDLNAGTSNNALITSVNVMMVEELLKDALDKLGAKHQLTLRVQRHVIRAQSQNMDLEWTLQKYQEILKLGQDTIGAESKFNEDTKRLMAHNLQDVMLRMSNELDQKSLKTKHQLKSIKSSENLSKSSSAKLDANAQNSKTDSKPSISTDKDLYLRKSLTAASLLAQGKLHLAVQLYKELLFYTSSTFGESDQTTLCTKQTLAAVLDQQGRFDEALRNYEETLTTAHSALGNNHRVTKIARKQLNELTKKLKRLNAICSYYTHERMKSDWFNRIFGLIMGGFLLWLLVEVLWSMLDV